VGGAAHGGIPPGRADMNQDEINERERTNPGNWGKVVGFYHSRLDSRVWVRKPQPWMGSSLNMAKPIARLLALLFILLLCLLVASMVFLVVHR
jgi:uncharacterized membrane protein